MNATVRAAVSLPDGVTVEKMGKVRVVLASYRGSSRRARAFPASTSPRCWRWITLRWQRRIHSSHLAPTHPPTPTPPTDESNRIEQDVFNTSYYPKGEDTDNSRKPWVVIDAAGLRLGRLSTLVATYLRGGNVGTYSPSMNMGTYVVVVNASQVVVSGKKFEDKLYKRHETGRPGSMKEESFKMLQARIPERIVEKAVRGMLPKNRKGRELFTQLKVYGSEEHPHAAQNPSGRHRGGEGAVLLVFGMESA